MIGLMPRDPATNRLVAEIIYPQNAFNRLIETETISARYFMRHRRRIVRQPLHDDTIGAHRCAHQRLRSQVMCFRVVRIRQPGG